MNVNAEDFFQRLWDYLCWVHPKWAVCKELFMHSEDRITLLNRRTGYVFRHVQDSLLDIVLLEIAKLLDPAVMGRSSNVSFERAIGELGLPHGDRRIDELKQELSGIKIKFEHILLQRNKRIAHHDKDVALNRVPISGVSEKKVSEAISDLEAFYNRLLMIRRGSQAVFDVLDSDAQGAVQALVEVLGRGNEQLDNERPWEKR